MKPKYVPDVFDNMFPEGLKCRECGNRVQTGQYILHQRVRNFGHLVWHFDCLKDIVDNALEDIESAAAEYDRIQDQETDIYVLP